MSVLHIQYESVVGNDLGGRLAKMAFDPCLKDVQALKWMTRGIPAKIKGVDDGLELNKEITHRGGLLTPGGNHE